MAFPIQRFRTLILGCDYPTFLSYLRYFSQIQENEIIGFVHCFDEDPPLKRINYSNKISPAISALKNLEKTIEDKKIHKCLFHVHNIPMKDLQAIINRVLSTGKCIIEFIPQNALLVRSFKPIITITSLVPKIGKSQLARYFCSVLSKENKKVAIILPINDIEPGSDFLDFNNSIFTEFKSIEDIPFEEYPQEDENLLKQYFSSGATLVYYSADIRKAVIIAEQKSDVIICDSRSCDLSYITSKSKFCVVDTNTIHQVRSTSLWPGLVNVMDSNNICFISRGNYSFNIEEIDYYKKLFNEDQKIFYANSEYTFEDSSGSEVFNKKVLVIDDKDNEGIGQIVAKSMGAYEFVDPGNIHEDFIESNNESSVVVKLPKSVSPTSETFEQTQKVYDKIKQVISKSDADIIILTLNSRIPDTDPFKRVLYASPEIHDIKGKLYEWLTRFFSLDSPPILKNHFQEQVEILKVLASTSSTELSVTNNESANRETFCRLFLQSHLPNGYRVTTGEITDSFNNKTGELDVIIVNDLAPRLSLDPTGSIISPILADSVLGVIEVKTTLTSENLRKALNQLRPVKSLMPMNRFFNTHDDDNKIINDPLEGKIITGIFSFNSSTDLEDNVPIILKSFPNVADFVVIPNYFCFFSQKTLSICGLSNKNNEQIDGYVKFKSKGMELALIFGVLNSISALRRFSGLNSIHYISGDWGNKEDEYIKSQNEALKKLGKIEKFIINNSQEKKVEYFKKKSEFVNNLKK